MHRASRKSKTETKTGTTVSASTQTNPLTMKHDKVLFPKMKAVEVHRHQDESYHASALPDLNALSAVKDRTEQMTVSEATAMEDMSAFGRSHHERRGGKDDKHKDDKQKHTRRNILIAIFAPICLIGIVIALYFTSTIFSENAVTTKVSTDTSVTSNSSLANSSSSRKSESVNRNVTLTISNFTIEFNTTNENDTYV